MVSVEQLRAKASRYHKLSQSITSSRDIDLYKILAAETERMAAKQEAEEAAKRVPA